MSVSVFSDISAKSSANFSNAVPTASQKNAVTKDVNKNKEADEKASKKEKIIKGIKTAVPIALPLIAIPVTALITYKISNKNFIKNNNV